MKLLPKSTRAGFSLIELVVTMTILVLLVGVVSFRSGGAVERSKASKIVQLVETLQTACALYHADTGSYPVEYTNYSAASRDLSAEQSVTGWNGPYLEGPLAHNNANPFGNLHVYDNPKANSWIDGFDLDGDGKAEVESNANMLWLTGIDEETAEQIDAAFDDGVDGTWSDSGRVRWNSGSKYAFILLYH